MARRDTKGILDNSFSPVWINGNVLLSLLPSLIPAITRVTLCWFKLPFVRRNSPWEKKPDEGDISLNGYISYVGSLEVQKVRLAAHEKICNKSGWKL